MVAPVKPPPIMATLLIAGTGGTCFCDGSVIRSIPFSLRTGGGFEVPWGLLVIFSIKYIY
ncbi:hypothetical protein ABIA14_000526 [Sinorhizobium fredii]